MIPVMPIFTGLILYIFAKFMENRRVPFYVVAMLFSIFLPLVNSLIRLQPVIWNSLVISVLIHLLVALPIFYFLDTYEDTIANWLGIFALGFVLFAFVL